MNYQKLFDHMFEAHGLTLTEGQMQDIIHEVNSMQPSVQFKCIEFYKWVRENCGTEPNHKVNYNGKSIYLHQAYKIFKTPQP